MNESHQPESPILNNSNKQLINDYEEAKRELDKLNYFDNYPIIKDFYLSVLSENTSTYLVKETDSKGKEHFYFENDMLEFFNEHESFFTEEDVYTLQNYLKDDLKHKEVNAVDYHKLAERLKNNVIDLVNEKNYFCDCEVMDLSEIKRFYDSLELEGNKVKIQSFIKELESFTGKFLNEDENLEEAIMELAESFVCSEKSLPIYNSYDNASEMILSKKFNTTLVCKTYEEENYANESLSEYIFGKENEFGILELLTNDNLTNKERKGKVIDSLIKTGLQTVLEDSYGLTEEILENRDKVQVWKEKNKKFSEQLILELENTDRYTNENTLSFTADLTLKDIILIDFLRDEFFASRRNRGEVDLSLLDGRLKIEKIYGGIYDPYNGGGSLMGVDFENIEVPIKQIKPVVDDLINSELYEADQCFGFNQKMYEDAILEVVYQKQDELKKVSVIKNKI